MRETRLALIGLRIEVENTFIDYVGQEGRGAARLVRDEILRMIDRRLASLPVPFSADDLPAPLPENPR